MADEAEGDKDIFSDLIPKEESDNENKLRDHITRNYTIIRVLIYQAGYTIPTIVHFSGEEIPRKNIGTIRKFLMQL